jgi:hypothetical protein
MEHDRGDEVVPVGEDVGFGVHDVADDALGREHPSVDFR